MWLTWNSRIWREWSLERWVRGHIQTSRRTAWSDGSMGDSQIPAPEKQKYDLVTKLWFNISKYEQCDHRWSWQYISNIRIHSSPWLPVHCSYADSLTTHQLCNKSIYLQCSYRLCVIYTYTYSVTLYQLCNISIYIQRSPRPGMQYVHKQKV